MKLDVAIDRSYNIRQSVHDVEDTLFIAICLVVLVIFLFLRNLSATLIPSLALPMSLISTFGVMALLGYSLDNLSLMALTLCVGFVVDDAIVMLENIVRHMENGVPPMEAAIRGSREIGFTIISMTLSLTAVFIPVLFMGGLLGRLLHEFAVTIVVAVLASGFVSLTLTPMMCSRFVHSEKQKSHGRLYNFFERFFDRDAQQLHAHAANCHAVSRHDLDCFAGGFGADGGFVLHHSQRIFRRRRHRTHRLDHRSGAGHFLRRDARRISSQAMKIVQADPNVDGVISAIGGSPLNNGRLFFSLKDEEEIERIANRPGIASRSSRKFPDSMSI